jgi:hypothetical protein
MKSPILLLPSLLLPLFALALATGPGRGSVPATRAARQAEIGRLRRQVSASSARLSLLEASDRNFLPR